MGRRRQEEEGRPFVVQLLMCLEEHEKDFERAKDDWVRWEMRGSWGMCQEGVMRKLVLALGGVTHVKEYRIFVLRERPLEDCPGPCHSSEQAC